MTRKTRTRAGFDLDQAAETLSWMARLRGVEPQSLALPRTGALDGGGVDVAHQVSSVPEKKGVSDTTVATNDRRAAAPPTTAT
jgi:hypothetical protein